ncbi:MAG: hypothetical protein ABL984_01980 [Pyrinomonadaceae bacterium]
MRLIVLIFLVLISAAEASAQCPTLEVIGPKRIVDPGENVRFELALSGGVSLSKIAWSVDKGTIDDGQGTRAITVLADRSNTVATLVVTVTVTGLPVGCANSFTMVSAIASRSHSYPIDEFVAISKNDQRGRLDLFFAELLENPSNTGFVTVYRRNQKEADSALRLYLSHARFRKFDVSRLTFGVAIEPETKTVLWRLSEGYSPWGCEKCKFVHGKDLKE